MAGIGYSYQPGATDIRMTPGSGPQQAAIAPQGPAKILSLRLPRNLGQSPTAARGLLASPGAGGSPALNAIIAALMRMTQPPMNAQGSLVPQGAAFPRSQGSSPAFAQGQSGAAPAPRITISDEERQSGMPGMQAPWQLGDGSLLEAPTRVGGPQGDAPGPNFYDSPIDIPAQPGDTYGGPLPMTDTPTMPDWGYLDRSGSLFP